jgi:hypothetical protein
MHEPMAGAAFPHKDESIGELFTQLVDDAKQAARDELSVYREMAMQRARAASTGLILIVVALLLSFAAIGTFVVMVAVALTPALGPLGAGAVVAVGTLIVAGLLGWFGAKSLADAIAGKGVAGQ